MKKKSCRRTEDEKTMHERAVKIRKMTDDQICEFIDHTYGRGMEEGARLAATQPTTTPAGDDSARRFVEYLAGRTGSGNRIGKGTVMYLSKELESAIAAGVFAEVSR